MRNKKNKMKINLTLHELDHAFRFGHYIIILNKTKVNLKKKQQQVSC